MPGMQRSTTLGQAARLLHRGNGVARCRLTRWALCRIRRCLLMKPACAFRGTAPPMLFGLWRYLWVCKQCTWNSIGWGQKVENLYQPPTFQIFSLFFKSSTVMLSMISWSRSCQRSTTLLEKIFLRKSVRHLGLNSFTEYPESTPPVNDNDLL